MQVTDSEARKIAAATLAFNLFRGDLVDSIGRVNVRAYVGTKCKVIRSRETIDEKARRVWRECDTINRLQSEKSSAPSQTL